MESGILVIKNISKNYAKHTVLKDVSLTIPKNAIYGLLGPNGAGKTTLIRIITQIIMADSGQINMFGEPLQPKHIQQIGYLPEERGLYKKMKVGEQLLYLAQLRGLSKADAAKKINFWLDKLSLSSWSKKKVEDLSKGMQQKVQFIATILHEPRLIILDEPFSGFDPVNANLIKDEILALQKKGSTIIFSTHRMESVEELCDHIALIHQSKKILEGPKQQIKDTYRTNTFIVKHKKALTHIPEGLVLSNSLAEEERFISTIQVKGEYQPNDILRFFIDNGHEVYEFHEKIPSINEIFIQKTQKESIAL